MSIRGCRRAVDWDRTTIAFREHVWDLGLGVARSDGYRATRAWGLDWADLAGIDPAFGQGPAKARGNALVFSGAGTDHLAVEDAKKPR